MFRMNEHICVAVNTKATGEKIRKLREKCGFSKTEVQESLGLVGVQSIYDWENGVKLPNLENALGLARLLGVDLDQLLVAQPLVKENATKTEQERSSSRKTGTNVRGHAAGRWQCQRSGGRHGNPAGRRNLGKVSLPGTGGAGLLFRQPVPAGDL